MWTRFRDSENKALFEFFALSPLSDSPDRVVFLSERDYAILLNMINVAVLKRRRVWTQRNGDMYQAADDLEWPIFLQWMQSLLDNLGGWQVSNEYLERIAIALEAMEANQETAITWQQMLDDLATTLGLANPFYLLAKAFSDMFPSMKNIKMNPWPLVAAIWRSRTFEVPMLAALAGMNTSLGAMAAAQVGEKTMSIIRTIASVFGGINGYYSGLRQAIFGDFNMLDFLLSLINAFIPDNEGGTGGTDPDTDPENRIGVQLNNSLINNQTFNVDCGGGGCGCVGSGDTDITNVNDKPDAPIPGPSDPVPPGFPTRPDYDSYRCKAAYYILRGYIGTLRNWGGLAGTAGGLTLAVIAGLLLLTVPPAGLMLILGALGVLAGLDFGLFSNLIGIADYIDEQIDDLACQVYNAGSTEEVRDIIIAAATDYIEANIGSGIQSTFITIASNLISNEQASALFEKSPEIDALPEEDCSACASLTLVGNPTQSAFFAGIGGFTYNQPPQTQVGCTIPNDPEAWDATGGVLGHGQSCSFVQNLADIPIPTNHLLMLHYGHGSAGEDCPMDMTVVYTDNTTRVFSTSTFLNECVTDLDTSKTVKQLRVDCGSPNGVTITDIDLYMALYT